MSTDENLQYDDGGVGGPGAPTPLTTLEVSPLFKV